MEDERFDMGMNVYCIKKVDGLQVGKMYHINGCGSMEYIYMETRKKGYGLGLQDPSDTKYKTYYYTIDEMNEHFITSEEYYENGLLYYTRNVLLEDIINEKN